MYVRSNTLWLNIITEWAHLITQFVNQFCIVHNERKNKHLILSYLKIQRSFRNVQVGSGYVIQDNGSGGGGGGGKDPDTKELFIEPKN